MTNATELLYHESMSTDAEKSAAKACLEWGLRKSKTRLLLFEFFAGHHRPSPVADILQWCRKKGVHLNKTTVYREVENLVNQGVLRAVQLTARVESYELASHEHHHHFVYTNYNFVTDVRFPEVSIKKTENLLEKEGVLVTHHSLEFFGLCKTCN